jgi:C1A family cysteine protease
MQYKLGGYRPDPPDDRYWGFETKLKAHLPAGAGSVDLRPYASPRHNQGETGSCVAQSVTKALENLERQKICRDLGLRPEQLGPQHHQDLSVLALYYLCRERMEPSQIAEDEGTFIWLACDCLRRFGVCTEQAWPFDEAQLFISPSVLAMREAYLHKISAYYRIEQTGQERVQSVIDALHARHPVVFGTLVGNAWAYYVAGQVLQLPASGAERGGHATHLVGWDEQRGLFIGENSWGTAWGDEGFYWMAPEVIADPRSDDFWVITGSWEDVHA